MQRAFVALSCLAAACGPEAPRERVPPPVAEAPIIRSEPLRDVDAIAIGWSHGCASSGGRVWCWGTPRAVESAQGPIHLAAPVPGVEDVVDIAAGGRQTCALTRAGEVHCWGERIDPPAADEPEVVVFDPVTGWPASRRPHFHAGPVRASLTGATAIDVGRAHACALAGEGVLWCWGSNASHEIGAYASLAAPHRVAEHVVSLQAGNLFTCYRTVGSATDTCIGMPPEPPHRGRVAEHSQDQYASTTCSLARGRVSCTAMPIGQLGTLAVPDIDGVVELAVGASHACARREDGSVHCWGDNQQAQLGGDAPIAGLNARRLAAGIAHTCAITEERTVVCWGSNDGGAIGADTTTTMHATPIPWLVQRIAD